MATPRAPATSAATDTAIRLSPSYAVRLDSSYGRGLSLCPRKPFVIPVECRIRSRETQETKDNKVKRKIQTADNGRGSPDNHVLEITMGHSAEQQSQPNWANTTVAVHPPNRYQSSLSSHRVSVIIRPRSA